MIRLFELRNEKKLTQRQIAKILNISQGTYNNWENGNTEPSIEQIIRLADYFDVSTDFLLGRTNEDKLFMGNNQKYYDQLRLLEFVSPEAQEAVITLLKELAK